ncbi:MAG: class II fructose-bisphosphate aldolase [Candidatus Pacebacteria bacterium]|nr:class II fructose-bisphosphate aldolase [Candidatus Paceibacterota bacterium]
MQEIDQLVYQAVFGNDKEKQQARFEIWQRGIKAGIIPSSINDLYMARGNKDLPNTFTVPAMNLRGMTYNTARAVFAAAIKNKVGAMIFEIARSEMAYTDQTPQEYVTVITAAALKEGWSGPLFVQGDHFQAKANNPGEPKTGEIDKIKALIKEALLAGFYNIDIDMSTLVDLNKSTEHEEQIPNYTYSLELAKYIRSLEPAGITVSLGGEIGHIGGKNSTIADFEAFMTGFNQGKGNLTGISKISIQTGTSHGGIVLADGSLAEIKLDFSLLKAITQVGQEKYQIGGSVQHGASTLPDEYFYQFVENEALEVHLATGLQNLILNHPAFPTEVLQQMYDYTDQNLATERKLDHTDEQFHYSLCKKTWGPLKKLTWNIPADNQTKIRQTLKEKFEFFFNQLNVINSQEIVNQYIKPVIVQKTLADFALTKKHQDVKDLSD